MADFLEVPYFTILGNEKYTQISRQTWQSDWSHSTHVVLSTTGVFSYFISQLSFPLSVVKTKLVSCKCQNS